MRIRGIVPLVVLLTICFCLQACYFMRPSKGGGNSVQFTGPSYHADDIQVPEGYKIELVGQGLTFPVGAAFDEKGRLYVVESGYSYDELWTTPQLLRMEPDGKFTVIAKGPRNGPWTGVVFHNGFFYVAEGGSIDGGRILRISKEGKMTTLISKLPSKGDHHTNGPAIGKDGLLYFSIGAATNSGIVGLDNYEFGWLKRHPKFHDIPCEDITLTGENFDSRNPLTQDEKDKATTGAFAAYGSISAKGEIIKGHIPCTGAIFRMQLNGGKPELVAWGLRNPFGLAFNAEGELYVTENGYDDRGSRPIWGAADVLWNIKPKTWYGWPDYSAGIALTTGDFKAPSAPQPQYLIEKHPNTLPQPAAQFGVHSSSNGIDFSIDSAFGFVGEAFVAQFGDMAPKVGKVMKPVGFKVVKVNVKNGVVDEFAVNNDPSHGPSSLIGKAGLERPVSVKFDREGKALYIVDFGVVKVDGSGVTSLKNTGAIWKITKKTN